jgi:hypothetical protein
MAALQVSISRQGKFRQRLALFLCVHRPSGSVDACDLNGLRTEQCDTTARNEEARGSTSIPLHALVESRQSGGSGAPWTSSDFSGDFGSFCREGTAGGWGSSGASASGRSWAPGWLGGRSFGIARSPLAIDRVDRWIPRGGGIEPLQFLGLLRGKSQR